PGGCIELAGRQYIRGRAQLDGAAASGGLKVSQGDQSTFRRFSADDLPLRRSVTSSNSIFCPSFRTPRPARSTALIWTKASLPPFSGWMKPKPFWLLNHFTVPLMGDPFASETVLARRVLRGESRRIRT